MKRLNGKTFLITGASSGIGEAFAKHVAQQKVNLVLVARSKDKLDALAKDLMTRYSITATVFVCDLEKPNAAAILYRQITEANITIDVLINNAGFGKWGDFLDYSFDDYSAMLNLNIIALTQLCHLFLPSMLARQSGGIINVASTAAFVPVPYAAVYSASKSYVLLFSEALYGECHNKGVTVMSLCPGGTASNFANVASKEKRSINAPLESAESVAANGIKAFLNGVPSVISGRSNKMVGFLPRFLSRLQVIKLTGWAWQKIMGNNEVAN